jgi:RecD/TraA family predicted helicase
MPVRELPIVYMREKFRFDSGDPEKPDTIIGVAKRENGDEVTIKGVMKGAHPLPHAAYLVYGDFREYRNQRNGTTTNQFCYTTIVESSPIGRTGTTKYLCLLEGIGPVVANQLWDKFDDQCVSLLRDNHEVAAAAVSSLSVKVALAAAAVLRVKKAREVTTIQLLELFDGYSFPAKLVDDCVDRFGVEAVSLVKKNPYLLLTMKGAGFKRVDRMYLDLGHDPDRAKRQALCVNYAITDNNDGHTWVLEGYADQIVGQNIGGTQPDAKRAVGLGARHSLTTRGDGLIRRMITQGVNGEIDFLDGDVWWIADGGRAAREESIVESLVRISSNPAAWPEVETLKELSNHQVDKLNHSMQSSFGIFAGGPGTGKSYTIAVLIKLLVERYGRLGKVVVAAPTGKAANRIDIALSEHGVAPMASTIHSLLKPNGYDGSVWDFEYGARKKLPAKFVLIDESSMIPTDLMAQLLEAINSKANVMLIGDTNQLPPIGHGCPLRDMVRSNRIAYGELTEPQRSSGRIVAVCDEIRRRVEIVESKKIDLEADMPENFRIVEAKMEQVPATVLALLRRGEEKYGYDPVWDAQVIVPINDKSPVSRKHLNKFLQDNLNPLAEGEAEERKRDRINHEFRVDDKVICTTNGEYPGAVLKGSSYAPDGSHRVANGDMGRVIEVREKVIIAQFYCPDRLVFMAAVGEVKVQLGFCCTCHKMQGSECKLAIPVLDDSFGAKRLCTREWLFTAFSRGKRLCTPVGSKAAMYSMMGKSSLDDRRTFLKELIQEVL